MMLDANERTALDQKLTLELRRGIVVLAALSALRMPSYGYSLRQRLVDGGLDVDQGTLYPLLRRLDDQGLLESEWDVGGARPRKYYRLSADGLEVLEGLKSQWDEMVRVVNGLFESTASENDSEQAQKKGPAKTGGRQ